MLNLRIKEYENTNEKKHPPYFFTAFALGATQWLSVAYSFTANTVTALCCLKLNSGVPHNAYMDSKTFE